MTLGKIEKSDALSLGWVDHDYVVEPETGR
jgi:hypothetical protein